MFTDRLRELIDEKCDGRQSVLAKKSGLATTVISSYFCRKSQPSLSQLIALSQALECSIDYLAGIEDDLGNIVIQNETAAPQLSESEQKLLENFRALPPDLKRRAESYLQNLSDAARQERFTINQKS